MNFPSSLSRRVLHCGAWIAVALLMACSVTVDSDDDDQTQALIDRLPAGATAIAWIDIEALAEAMPPEEWNNYQEMLQGGEDMESLEHFAEATGIDLREDMKQIAAAMLPGGGEDDDPVVLLSLDFDEDKLLALTADAETLTYEGVTLYDGEDVARNFEEVVGSDDPEAREGVISGETEITAEPGTYLAILDSQTLAMGTEEDLKVLIDVGDGRHDSLKTDPEMNDLISDVAGRGQIWFVATSATWDDQIDDLGAGGGMVPTAAIESIEVATMSMRIGDGITLRLAGIAATAEAAQELAVSLNGLTAMGKMMLQGSEPEVFSILDRGVTVGQDDRTVHIEADLSAADIEALRSMAEEMDGVGIGG